MTPKNLPCFYLLNQACKSLFLYVLYKPLQILIFKYWKQVFYKDRQLVYYDVSINCEYPATFLVTVANFTTSIAASNLVIHIP